MFLSEMVWRALKEKREQFLSYRKNFLSHRDQIRERWKSYPAREPTQIIRRLKNSFECGAIPSEELLRYESWTVPFEKKFPHRMEAQAWAKEVLKGRYTFAVDGSQLLPEKSQPVPVALVQVGWFCNPHSQEERFSKELQVELLGPLELLDTGSEEKLYHDQAISLRRYQMEVEKLSQLCREYSGKRPYPVGFFDGSLVVSFAEDLMEFHRASYLTAARSLLKTSRDSSVPIVGYIDRSLARDLVRMFFYLEGEELPTARDSLRDLDLISQDLKNWGDRTVAFILARPGIYSQYGSAGGGIGFIYLKTAALSLPVRVEFPLWVLERGLLDEVVSVILAESIVGSGYPYPLETADQLAWISQKQRINFNFLLEEFLQTLEIPSYSYQKQLSKERRRE